MVGIGSAACYAAHPPLPASPVALPSLPLPPAKEMVTIINVHMLLVQFLLALRVSMLAPLQGHLLQTTSVLIPKPSLNLVAVVPQLGRVRTVPLLKVPGM